MNDVIEKIKKSQRREEKKLGALSATYAILEMDPHAREDLITYIQAVNECVAAGDQEELAYLANAIREVMEVDGVEDGPDLDGWEEKVASSAQGRDAATELAAETESFFDAYQRCKVESGLTTIRTIAEAAGLSTTTVQAIEKQRVKPIFKTIKALAKAFNVDPKVLMGH